MSRLHLISSEVSGVVTYYTADSSALLTAIGTTIDFTKGFGDDILALITNATYSTLTNGKVWTNDTDIDAVVTTETDGSGYIMTRKETAINTKGYSGVSSLVPTYSGSPKFAISFSGNEYFMTRGPGYIASTTKLLPSDATARAAIATIDSSYANLFDGSTATVWDSAVALAIIPITFATARKIRKFYGRLGLASIMPVTIELQVYDTANSVWVSLDTINVATTDVDFNDTFANSITSTKYQFKISYTADTSGKTAELEELNMYEETTITTWVGCSKAEVATKGMTGAVLAALTLADYASIFADYQIDYYIYVPSGSSVTSMVASMPPNTAPSITGFTATPGSNIHAQDVTIAFNVVDLEKQDTTYKVVVNGTVLADTTSTPDGGIVSLAIPNALMKIGSNTIDITAVDELGATQTSSYTLTKVDSLPTYIGMLVDNEYSFTLNDADGDKVKFKSEFNGVLIEPEGDLSDVPFSHTTVINKETIRIGEQNTLTITITDAVGGQSVITETFIGVYYGLMFLDDSDNFLTTDLGKLLKYLEFKGVTSGRASTPVEFRVLNKTNNQITSLSIDGPGFIDPDKNAKVELCINDQFLTNGTSISIGNLISGQKISVYARINSTLPNTAGDFVVTFTGRGTK